MWQAIVGQAIAQGAGTAWTLSEQLQESKRNREFQREMSNTAIRRQIDDLRAAGINPLLAAKIGGASTPGGSQANIPDMGAAISQGAQTGASLEIMKSQATSAKTKAEIDKGALKLYKNDPMYREATNASQLMNLTNQPGTVRTGVTLGETAAETVKKTNEKINEWMDKQYKKIESKMNESRKTSERRKIGYGKYLKKVRQREYDKIKNIPKPRIFTPRQGRMNYGPRD